MILTQVIIFFIIVILEVALLQFILELLELQGLTGEPINSAGNELLLDIFAKLIVQLKALLDIRCSIIVIFLCWRFRGREEVEK
jgi:hypothetical protein